MTKSFRARVFSKLARTISKSRRLGDQRRIEVVKLPDLLAGEPTVILRSLAFRDGNVSAYEMFVIAALVADRAPACIVEIGTFNGNTTLQMAENAPAEAEVITLDLPIEPAEIVSTKKAVDQEDFKYIQADVRTKRRFVGTAVERKIQEVFGDSALFDFHAAVGARKIDFAFIDGSHSYDYVKNDTEKILGLLAPGGIVLWHDYDPFWQGVCKYLNELQPTRLLRRIEGTTLVYYRHPGGN